MQLKEIILLRSTLNDAHRMADLITCQIQFSDFEITISYFKQNVHFTENNVRGMDYYIRRKFTDLVCTECT